MGYLAALLTVVFVVFMLIRFTKQTIWTLVVISAIVASPFAYLYLKEAQDERQQKMVTVSASYAPQACSTELPLLVIIKNGSNRTVSRVDWDFEARRPGHSTNLVDGFRDYRSDKILKPKEESRLCYSVPPMTWGGGPSTLEWSGSAGWIVFDR